MKNVLKHKWVAHMTDAMCMTHPDVSRDKIERIVTKIYNQRVKDTEVKIFNNYENIVANTTLLGVVDWIDQTKPLIAESGVFFYPKHQRRNVNVEIIKECMLDARKIHKKEKFQAMEAGDTFLAAVKDIQQSNDKKAANSGYGAEGQPSSFLYNVHSAMSVTASGRGQLSTACNCFENLLADNVKFFHMTEFFTFINNITREQSEWEFDTFDIVRVVPSRKQWVSRFKQKFGHESLCNEDQLSKVYDYLDEEMRVRTYYKANLRDFLMLTEPSDLYGDIVCTDVDFIDPNKIPPELKKSIGRLTNIVMEFVGYKYGVFRYEDRARYQNRKIAIIMDTDSNFLYYGDIMRFLYDKILPIKMFKSKKAAEAFKLRALNVLSEFSTKAISQTLYHYLGKVNVAEEDRKHIVMKNEFYYPIVIVTYAKKSYVGLQARQEEVIFPDPKLDVKGVNFFKSTASHGTSDFIYQDILMDQLLAPKDGRISLHRVYRKIHNFQQKITGEIAEGNMDFLKRSIKVKSADAYANPMRIGQYKAVYVWNKVNRDEDRIELPATVTLVKVQLRSKKDVARLENWPHIYEKMINLFDTDPEIGDYVDDKDGKLKKGKGIKAIALPDGMDEVPDWILAIIDVETLVSDNMSLFTQLYRPLGMSKGTTSHNGSSIAYYTNIVRI